MTVYFFRKRTLELLMVNLTLSNFANMRCEDVGFLACRLLEGSCWYGWIFEEFLGESASSAQCKWGCGEKIKPST